MKSLRTMILALTAVLVTAAPAGATTGVLAEAKPWQIGRASCRERV